jgi:hypothetical protein
MSVAKISARGTNGQQVQNELDHLAKHHLIVKMENDGSVKDGSRYLYQKDPTVRANKDRIVRLADNRKEADRVATKRRPVVGKFPDVRQITRRDLKKKKHLTVLYLSANPDLSNPLRVDAEVRRVQESVRASAFRDNISIEYRPAADLVSLIDGLNDHRPQIVHFSGHGDDRGISTDSGRVARPSVQTLSFDLLAKALKATDHPPQVVILNSCKSSGAKNAILAVVKILISMRVSVSDIAAATFGIRFYAAIGGGQSVKAAFEQGKIAVEMTSISELDTPELQHTTDVNPGNVVLV